MFGKKKAKKRTAKAKPKEETEEEAGMAEEKKQSGAASSEAPQMTLRYIDRSDCDETFADSINALAFDGQALRIEFGVTRLDERKADGPLSGRRYPACRLVLTPVAAVDLINKMQQVGAALAQAGVVKTTASPAGRDKAKESAN